MCTNSNIYIYIYIYQSTYLHLSTYILIYIYTNLHMDIFTYGHIYFYTYIPISKKRAGLRSPKSHPLTKIFVISCSFIFHKIKIFLRKNKQTYLRKCSKQYFYNFLEFLVMKIFKFKFQNFFFPNFSF